MIGARTSWPGGSRRCSNRIGTAALCCRSRQTWQIDTQTCSRVVTLREHRFALPTRKLPLSAWRVGATCASRNVEDFAETGVELVAPWRVDV